MSFLDQAELELLTSIDSQTKVYIFQTINKCKFQWDSANYVKIFEEHFDCLRDKILTNTFPNEKVLVTRKKIRSSKLEKNRVGRGILYLLNKILPKRKNKFIINTDQWIKPDFILDITTKNVIIVDQIVEIYKTKYKLPLSLGINALRTISVLIAMTKGSISDNFTKPHS